jgi:hypothetical protein
MNIKTNGGEYNLRLLDVIWNKSAKRPNHSNKVLGFLKFKDYCIFTWSKDKKCWIENSTGHDISKWLIHWCELPIIPNDHNLD